MEEPCYWVYILLCENHSYYTGYTNDLEKRYQSHLDGTGKCKYTRSFKPLQMAQHWNMGSDKTRAMKGERVIKRLSRKDKEQLIAYPEQLDGLLDTCKTNERPIPLD